MAQDGMDFDRNGETLHTSFEVRHARPEAVRTQPIRNWNGIFAAPAEPATSAAEPTEPASAETVDPDSAREGVAAGYRVIDEYLRQGRKAARDFWSPSSARDRSASSPDDPASADATGSSHPASDVSRLGERWLRSLGEFGTNWLELMQAMSRSETPPAESDDDASAGPFAVGNHGDPRPTTAPSVPERAAAGLPRIAFAITSAKPVEVKVNLDPSAWDAELAAAPLSDMGGIFPAIRGVKVVANADPISGERSLRLEAVIAAEQPSGTYHGVVLAVGQDRPVGTLSFCLS
jgi:hypothetical protein